MTRCFAAGVDIGVMQGFWQVSFDSVSVDGKSVLGATSAVLDTGSSRMVGDPDTVTTVYNNIPGSALVKGTWTSTSSSGDQNAV